MRRGRRASISGPYADGTRALDELELRIPFRGDELAGLAVVPAIFISACVAPYETIQRLIHPQAFTHLWVLAAAGVIGFIGNELAAQIRLRGGRRLASPALIADGNTPASMVTCRWASGQARLWSRSAIRAPTRSSVSRSPSSSSKITRDSWQIVSRTDPGQMVVEEAA